MLTIFYTPLAQVYRAANIADSLNDLQNFISDLIRTVEAVDTCMSQILFSSTLIVENSVPVDLQDTHAIVQAFIDLIQRHEQAFYSFVHQVHSKGEGLFNDFMQWIELFLTVLRDGLGEGLSVEFLLPHVGEEREQIISELDKVVLYHYKLKILYEEKLRRRFGRVQGDSMHLAADAEDAALQDLLDSVTGELNFGELASGDALDLAAQETDEECSSEDYSTSEDNSDESDSQTSTLENVPPESLPTSPLSAQTLHPYGSSTILRGRPPSPIRHSLTTDPRPRRSLSLKSVRSLISLNHGISSHRSTPPPVPPLPASVKSAASVYSNSIPQKPLPPRPLSQHYQERSSSRTLLPQRESRSQTPQRGQPPRRPKPIKQTVNPPDLQLIPQILPLFVEMVSAFH